MNNLSSEIVNVNQYIINHKDEFNKEIGYLIKQVRKRKDISIDTMSARTLMVPSYISKLENGMNGISLNKFVVVCNALEIRSQQILDEFLYSSKIQDDLLYEELQKGKNLSKNIINFLKIN